MNMVKFVVTTAVLCCLSLVSCSSASTSQYMTLGPGASMSYSGPSARVTIQNSGQGEVELRIKAADGTLLNTEIVKPRADRMMTIGNKEVLSVTNISQSRADVLMTTQVH